MWDVSKCDSDWFFGVNVQITNINISQNSNQNQIETHIERQVSYLLTQVRPHDSRPRTDTRRHAVYRLSRVLVWDLRQVDSLIHRVHSSSSKISMVLDFQRLRRYMRRIKRMNMNKLISIQTCTCTNSHKCSTAMASASWNVCTYTYLWVRCLPLHSNVTDEPFLAVIWPLEGIALTLGGTGKFTENLPS